MPFIKVYTTSEDQEKRLEPYLEAIQRQAAKELSCGELHLEAKEFSIRVIRSDLARPIGDIELEISAYSFHERVVKQDAISLNLKRYIEKFTDPYSVYVWLQLSELGHSAE